MARTKALIDPAQERRDVKALRAILVSLASLQDGPRKGSARTLLRRAVETLWEDPHDVGPYSLSPNYRHHFLWSRQAVRRVRAIEAAPEAEENTGHNRGLRKEHVVPYKWLIEDLLAEQKAGRVVSPAWLRRFLKEKFVIAVVTHDQDKVLTNEKPEGWSLEAPDAVWVRYARAHEKHPDAGLDWTTFAPYTPEDPVSDPSSAR